MCYKNREELQAGFITAGWDRKKGPQVGAVVMTNIREAVTMIV